MSLLALLQQSQNGEGLGQLASQFGLDTDQAGGLAEMLAPAIGSAAKQQAEAGGLENLLGALKGEGMGAMFDDAAAAAAPEGQKAGMDFLQGLLGGESNAQELASEAASRTGVDAGTVAQFLPALAAMLQGGMQKNMPDTALDGMMAGLGGGKSGGGLGGLIGGFLGGNKGGSGPDLGMLTRMLDADGDGSPMDDILGKFLK